MNDSDGRHNHFQLRILLHLLVNIFLDVRCFGLFCTSHQPTSHFGSWSLKDFGKAIYRHRLSSLSLSLSGLCSGFKYISLLFLVDLLFSSSIQKKRFPVAGLCRRNSHGHPYHPHQLCARKGRRDLQGRDYHDSNHGRWIKDRFVYSDHNLTGALADTDHSR